MNATISPAASEMPMFREAEMFVSLLVPTLSADPNDSRSARVPSVDGPSTTTTSKGW